jgi:poly(A) polymerase
MTAGGDPVATLAGLDVGGWLVGGAVRDRLLGRDTNDFDVALPGDVEPVARALGRAAGGFAFRLSEAFDGWRVVAHDHRWQVDLLALAGETIEADLGRRDLTVNAIATALDGTGDVDPFGGRDDIAARCLRAVARDSFSSDPLRVMRLARLVCELDFSAEADTERLAAAAAGGLPEVAPERLFAELRRIVCSAHPLAGLAAMDRTGATREVLPELAALDGMAQNRFHHLDVGEHTRAALAAAVELERDPEPVAGPRAGAVAEVMSAPLANEMTRWGGLRFGALLHDIAKPVTEAHTAEGRVTFIGHDVVGAQLSAEILGRLRTSERLRDHVAALARHHLRLGFLVHHTPLSRRAIYDYLNVTTPVGLDVTLLTVADRVATGGDNSQRAIARHLELAREMVGEALGWLREPPRAPVRGDELASALGIAPGPQLGGLLAELRAARFSGEVVTRAQAIERARQLLGSGA